MSIPGRDTHAAIIALLPDLENPDDALRFNAAVAVCDLAMNRGLALCTTAWERGNWNLRYRDHCREERLVTYATEHAWGPLLNGAV